MHYIEDEDIRMKLENIWQAMLSADIEIHHLYAELNALSDQYGGQLPGQQDDFDPDDEDF